MLKFLLICYINTRVGWLFYNLIPQKKGNCLEVKLSWAVKSTGTQVVHEFLYFYIKLNKKPLNVSSCRVNSQQLKVLAHSRNRTASSAMVLPGDRRHQEVPELGQPLGSPRGGWEAGIPHWSHGAEEISALLLSLCHQSKGRASPWPAENPRSNWPTMSYRTVIATG